MSNLTADTQFGSRTIDHNWSFPFSFRIDDAVRIFAGAFCGLPGANALTSGRGYVDRWQDHVNIQWAGYALPFSHTGGLITSVQTNTAANVNSVLGDSDGSPVPEISVETGPFIMRRATVTGVSAQSDVWRTLVYLSTDNFEDMTTTATTYAPPIGKVIEWVTSTTCSVQFFGMLRSVATS